jgi:hypothetical protein
MKSNHAIFLLSSLMTLFSLTSCQKQPTTDTTRQTDAIAATSDDVEADETYTEISNDVTGVNRDIAFTETEVGNDTRPWDPLTTRCYTVSISPLALGVFPKTVIIDFGTSCLGKDGKTRKGKIITVFTGPLRIPGSKATTTFDAYYVNDVHVEGTHVIDNNSTADIRRFTRTITDGKLSKPNGNYINWNATHTNIQTTGLGTPNYHWDDEFDITGNASGQNSRNGTVNNWTRTITSPVHKKANCRWFDKGTTALTFNGYSGTFDFGNGDCDNKAVLLYNGGSIEVTLH